MSAPQPAPGPQPNARPQAARPPGPGPQAAGPQSGGSLADAAGLRTAEPALYARIRDRSWQLIMAAAVVSVVLGILAVAWPSATLTVVAVIFGIQLVVIGVIRLFDGLTGRGEAGGMRAAAVLIGLLGLVVGLYCIRHLSVTVVLIAFLLGVFWVLHGIIDLAAAATTAGPGRWLTAVIGGLSLVAGLIVIFAPEESLTFLLVVLGIWLMAYGILLALVAWQARHLARQASGRAA